MRGFVRCGRRRQAHLRVLIWPALLAAMAFVSVPVAFAEITGDCHASINGTDVGSISSADPGQAIQVPEHTQVNVTLDSPAPISELAISLEVAGLRLPAVQRPVNGSNVRETVPVDDYAKYGVGLYKVIGEGRGAGQACSGAALVRVAGNPLQTAAGIAGAAVAGIGALAVAGTSVAAAFNPGRGLRFSGIGLVGGLLAGLGGLVLAQQYGVAYPSGPVTLSALGGGVAGGGLVLPSIFNLIRG